MRSDGQILVSTQAPNGSPFDLDDAVAYAAWRAEKLANSPRSLDELRVEVARLDAPSEAEQAALRRRCGCGNMALYASRPAPDEAKNRADLRAFGAVFGLRVAEDHRSAEADGVVSLEVVDQGGRLGYIPYTDRAINWHTDGYYNFHGPSRCIQAMLLHCARRASAGGENRLLDPDIAYIRLRDDDPDHIAALSSAEAMTIPENVEANGRVRAVNAGPVFYVDPATGKLGMRYTARTRNVVWRDDAATRRAVRRLEEILDADPFVLKGRLEPGEGLICNNVLHDRSAFAAGEGSSARLLYRIRYYNRIA